MSWRVSFRPQAEAEAVEARDWYENRRDGLGTEFRAALEDTIDRIVTNPLMHPEVHDETRRAILQRFPYVVYYRVVGEEIVVLAVHGRQHPRRWQMRR